MNRVGFSQEMSMTVLSVSWKEAVGVMSPGGPTSLILTVKSTAEPEHDGKLASATGLCRLWTLWIRNL